METDDTILKFFAGVDLVLCSQASLFLGSKQIPLSFGLLWVTRGSVFLLIGGIGTQAQCSSIDGLQKKKKLVIYNQALFCETAPRFLDEEMSYSLFSFALFYLAFLFFGERSITRNLDTHAHICLHGDLNPPPLIAKCNGHLLGFNARDTLAVLCPFSFLLLVYLFFVFNCTGVLTIISFLAAKRLPRLQPAQNPSGMVLVDRPADRTASASCCS